MEVYPRPSHHSTTPHHLGDNCTENFILGGTVKILKFGTPQTIAIIVLKNRKVWRNIALMHPKDADGMANSVDPDQTASSEAVWSWSALFAETYLSQYIEFVR